MKHSNSRFLPRHVTLLVLAFAANLGMQNVYAQSATEKPAPASAAPIVTKQREVELLVLRAAYDEAIFKANALLETEPDNTRLRYFRGRAAYSLGSFAPAREDMAMIGDYTPYKQWPTAHKTVEMIDELLFLRPKNLLDVRSDDGQKVIFRVYYEQRNVWTENVVRLLPQAYGINRELVGGSIEATPVFVFADYARFRRFLAVRSNKSSSADVASWMWAAGSIGGLYICESVLGISPREANAPKLRGAIVHEINHCLVQRVTQDTPLPKWFLEGLALSTEYRMAPERETELSNRFQKALNADAVVSLQVMADRAAFEDTVNERDGKNKGVDVAAQAWSMAIYFRTLVPLEKTQPFLERIAETRKFEVALKDFTGLSPEEFYAAWRAQLRA